MSIKFNQSNNFKLSVNRQVEIENKVRQILTDERIKPIFNHFYMDFAKTMALLRGIEKNILYEKWKARGLNSKVMKLIATTIFNTGEIGKLVDAVGEIDPNGDSTPLEWIPSSGVTHWNLIDEGETPNLNDYVEATFNETDVYDMSSLDDTVEVKKVTIYFYYNNAWHIGLLDSYLNVSLNFGSGWLPNVKVTLAKNINTWGTAEFSGNWNKSELDNLKVRIIGDIQFDCLVYSLYGKVNYKKYD